MNPVKITKVIDYSKLNIGVELECQLVYADSLEQITRDETQRIFKEIVRSFGWKIGKVISEEIQNVHKEFIGFVTEIKIDLCYSILEISTLSPIPSVELLEKIYREALLEFRQTLAKLGVTVWPFGVAPASSGLYRFPFKPREECTDVFFKPLRAIDYLPRFCHITSEQVSIDVSVPKMIPTINSLYKNLGNIIERFANSPLFVGGILYKEGRFHFWNDIPEITSRPRRYSYGVSPVFPDRPFRDLQDFYSWVWQSEYCFVMRNGEAHVFRDNTMSPVRFLEARKGIVLTPGGQEIEINLEKNDIELLFKFNWLDFKPHFDFDDAFTVDEFLSFWNRKKLDEFIVKHALHAYLEIRPCSPHYEHNAMDIPRYFYDIFAHLEAYIAHAEHIDWEDARIARDKALLA